MATALITGASRGIGKAIAGRLADEGYDLFLVARDANRLSELADKLSGRTGVSVQTFAVDLVETESPAATAEAFNRQFASLDVLVNNAGIAPAGDVTGYSRHQWESVFALNTHAPFFLTQALLHLLRDAGPGFLINIASVVARKGYANQALYGASKHALLGWTKALAAEIPSAELRVHALLPGGVDTEMIHEVRPDIDSSQLIDPGEIAETVAFLLTMRGNAMIDQIEIRRASKTGFQ